METDLDVVSIAHAMSFWHGDDVTKETLLKPTAFYIRAAMQRQVGALTLVHKPLVFNDVLTSQDEVAKCGNVFHSSSDNFRSQMAFCISIQCRFALSKTTLSSRLMPPSSKR
ncbi:uncharacterized protein LOC127847166 [Dreissena polymorpha]|uniref:uncharacterized protein LOC127847166 n=1 Tax=Dreissena polymorpha TaxID=45954 RepID=UPI002263B2AC|nr:uncharacterized protein LOC127847166 [Dreissena polymorpha]